ncbi:MAG: hypothetical protein K1X72_21395 [Pyrinomonadaceae bacterium]|nr:hypothetical protein [Pyrinomonadaceae bacterium]
MKLFKTIPVFFMFCAFAVTAFAQSSTNDIFGYYMIEKAPKAFADISEIHLAGNYGAAQKPPFYGLIRLKAKKAKDFKLLKPTLDGKNLTFSTTSVNGISYTFTGTFTRLGDFPNEQPEGEILLKGTLTKLKGKAILAKANLSFSYTAGD